MPAGSVVRLTDPTVCAKCGTDWGDRDLTEGGGRVALCERCREAARNYAFPNWIKISFAALLVVAAIDFALNFHYLVAMHEAKKAARLMRTDPDRGAAMAESALARVPDSQMLKVFAKVFRAASLLQHEHSSEAMAMLEPVRRSGVADEMVDDLYTAARIGVAFDRKNYDEFLSLSLDLMKKHPNEPNVIGGVASAYACKYAVTGDDSFKRLSLDFLDSARRRAGKDNPDFAEYEARIQHRLATREIIDAAEYHRRFPAKH